MQWRRYLPSAQFSVLAVSLIASIGLVYAADYVTHKEAPAQLTTAQTTDSAAAQDADWQKALDDVQAQSGTSLPTPPDQTTVDAMVKGATTPNVTDSIGKTLLVSLAAAQSQGLGGDIPTQDSLVSQATALLPKTHAKQYTASDLTLVPSSKDSEHAYGNQLMATLEAHQGASMQQTLAIYANVVDTNSSAEAKKLLAVEAEYRSLLKDLVAIPVPQTLSPLHIQILNDFAQLADTFPDMASMVDDPVRGLSGLSNYKSLTEETTRVFINIAQGFDKDGILFTSGEPGASWTSVLSMQ